MARSCSEGVPQMMGVPCHTGRVSQVLLMRAPCCPWILSFLFQSYSCCLLCGLLSVDGDERGKSVHSYDVFTVTLKEWH